MKCPNCGFKARKRAKFCGMCGTRLALVCPVCGTLNPRVHHFCSECGASLAVENGTPPLGTPLSVVTPPEPEPTPPPSSPDVLPPLEGERRVATIILADVKGSTDLMEQVGTEVWVKLMNRVLQILETEVYRFGGKVDQFRGDGLVAFFGTTTAHEDDPERAVLAALSMQEALQPYAAELEQREGIHLALRVGVNTGEVIVTSVGNDRQYREETAMGEAIALAARMETAAEPGTVLVSENTYRLTATQFEWLPLGEIMVKGVSHPIAVYRPLAPRLSTERPAYELPNPVIGRDAELESLKARIADLSDGIGGVVIITGEQGMGKTVLTDEVRHYLARQNALLAEARDKHVGHEDALPAETPGVMWLRGRCRSYTQSQPFAMWQDVLRNWLGIRQNEPREQTRDRLRQQAEALWGEQANEYYPDLAALLALPLEAEYAERLGRLDADSLRQQFFLAVRRWIEALADQNPLILNFSDMQWVDTTSLDLLKYCLPLCDYTALLWLFVFRPDRTSQIWEFRHFVETEYPHRLTMLTLAPLTTEQSRAMITALIGDDVLPEATRDLIVQKAEGNPYYIQEMVRSLIFQGILVREPETGRWRTTQAVTNLTLPDSLQSLLLASIDRLTPEEQHVLQIASVIGTVFWSTLLEELVGNPAQVKAHLTALQRAQLIRERGRTQELGIEYVFKSPLIRDAAYDRLLSTQRAAYHLRIAEFLEDRCCASLAHMASQFYGILAYHYRRAGKPEKELEYVLEGTEHAKTIYANAEAGKQYTRALEILDVLEHQTTDPAQQRAIREQRFRVLNERREVFYLMGQFEAMWADAKALLPLAEQLADNPAFTIDALLRQPSVADYQCEEEIEAGIPMAQRALELAQQLGDRHREMESLIAIVNLRLALSDPSWHPLAERALELARQLQDLHYEARLLISMGGIFAFSDEPACGTEYLEAAAALVMRQGLDDKIIQMSLLNLLGLEFERNGDYYRLLTEYQQERLNISREIGHRPHESKALQACGRIQGIYLGDYPGGLALLEDCQRILTGTRDEVYPLFHIAQIQSEQGQYPEAIASLERIRAIGEPVQDRGLASLKLVWIILYNALGDEAHLSKALDLADTVQELAAQSPLVSQQYAMAALCKAAAAHLRLANVITQRAVAEAHLESALQASQKALDIYNKFGFVQITECVSEEILFRHSQALAANGQPEEANKYLRRAYDEMTRKHALIPPDSYFRRTYLENIPLHQEIRAAYAARVGLILTEAGQVLYATPLPELLQSTDLRSVSTGL
ncbi:MAG TPA: adenylate/guanylate cyclase domain-containing protein [Anaerolineae bacterium]|nr:adenylate/guanylate cyclase domain-containing protein [Anaerolineae bacterium]